MGNIDVKILSSLLPKNGTCLVSTNVNYTSSNRLQTTNTISRNMKLILKTKKVKQREVGNDTGHLTQDTECQVLHITAFHQELYLKEWDQSFNIQLQCCLNIDCTKQTVSDQNNYKNSKQFIQSNYTSIPLLLVWSNINKIDLTIYREYLRETLIY